VNILSLLATLCERVCNVVWVMYVPDPDDLLDLIRCVGVGGDDERSVQEIRRHTVRALREAQFKRAYG
jgi:hypothetical protein